MELAACKNLWSKHGKFSFLFFLHETWQLWAILSPKKSFVKAAAAPLSPRPFLFSPSGEMSQHTKKDLNPVPGPAVQKLIVDQQLHVPLESGASFLTCAWDKHKKVAPKGCSPLSRANALLLALPTQGKDIVFRFIIIEYSSLRDFGS
jgi:hypothetical protein